MPNASRCSVCNILYRQWKSIRTADFSVDSYKSFIPKAQNAPKARIRLGDLTCFRLELPASIFHSYFVCQTVYHT